MGSFQICDALSILFKLEKPLTSILRVSSFCREKVARCRIFFKTLDWKFQLKSSKEIPH
jgi:hypothetical protein